MTETVPAGSAHESPEPRRNTLVQLGGILGVAASCVGLLIFLIGCAGSDRGFAFYWLPMVLATAGMLATIVGGVFRHGGVEDTPILAGLFLNLFGLVGGLLECALWKGWHIFYRAVSL
jgi:hypothetical protein